MTKQFYNNDRIIIEATDELILPNFGLSLLGKLASSTNMSQRMNQLTIAGDSQLITNSDIILSMMGLIAQGNLLSSPKYCVKIKKCQEYNILDLTRSKMQIDDLNKIGTYIRKYRESSHMTQAELAEKADLSLSFINYIENNNRKISLETLIKLANGLNVPLSSFLIPFETEDDQELSQLFYAINTSEKKELLVKIFNEIITATES